MRKLKRFRTKLQAPKPPMVAAMGLVKAYRDKVVGGVRASVKRHILDEWNTNAIAFGPNFGHRDSAWINRRISNVKADAKQAIRDTVPDVELAATRVDTKNKSEMARLIPVSIRKEVGGHEAIDKFRQANLDRITSLTDSGIEELRDLLEDAEIKSMRVEDLADLIEEKLGVSESKAALLARDQTLKLNAALTQKRQTQSGIEKYEWSTSDDERVRPAHADLDGQEFYWSDPPVTNDDGDENAPGEDYQCRCVAIPILPDLPDDDDTDDAEDE
jgi:SPP1 gp7 family putative phage head morphogenesis protein